MFVILKFVFPIKLIVTKNWYVTESLISRIMVAGAGGGAEWAASIGGNGGGLIGGNSTYTDPDFYTICQGATQTSGGTGGGGYYGGTTYDYTFAGSGGSSFISGHEGCNAVENNVNEIIHTGQPNHYSGYVFQNTKMIDGNQTMPLIDSLTEEGIHDGFGAFRITILYSPYPITTETIAYIMNVIFYSVIIGK